MKLFEVDSGSVRDVLRVLQGKADKAGKPSKLNFTSVQNIFNDFDLPLGSIDALIAFKNTYDPNGDVFDVSNDGKGDVILNTKVKDKENVQPNTTAPSVDQMASSGAKKLTPDI